MSTPSPAPTPQPSSTPPAALFEFLFITEVVSKSSSVTVDIVIAYPTGVLTRAGLDYAKKVILYLPAMAELPDKPTDVRIQNILPFPILHPKL